MNPINTTASLSAPAANAAHWHDSPQQDFTAYLISAAIDVPHGVQVQLPRASETARDISAFLSPLRPNEPVATQVAVWLNTGFEPAALRGAVALASRGVAIHLHHLPAEMNWEHDLAQFGGDAPAEFVESGQCLSLAQRFNLLASAGVDLDDRAGATLSPVELAVARDNTDALAALREVVPARDLSRCDDQGFGLIHHAAANGASHTLSALIEAGVPFDQNGPAGATPLHLAAAQGQLEVLPILLEAAPETLNAAGEHGTPAITAARAGKTAMMLRLLAAPGLDATVAGNTAQALCDAAITSGHVSSAQVLMEKFGAQVPPNALRDAARGGNTPAVKALLGLPRVGVNQNGFLGETALHWAARYGRTEALKTLLTAPNIDVKASNADGKTPRRLAREKGKTNIVTLLTAHPAYGGREPGRGVTGLLDRINPRKASSS